MDPAITSLIILGICIILFLTKIPNAVTAIIGCCLFVLTKVCSFGQVFSGFSDSTVALLYGMLVVGIAMQDTGAAKLIGDKVLVLSRHNQRLFILLAGVVSICLSSFLANSAVIAIFLPIIASVSESDPTMNRMNLTLPVTMGAMFGGVCTLVGSTPQLTAQGILTPMTGLELQLFDYTLPGVLIAVLYMIYVETIGFKLGNKIWGNREAVEVLEADKKQGGEGQEISKKKLIIMLIIFILTVISFAGAWISTAMTSVLAAIACVLTGCTTHKSVMKKMNWNVLLMLAGCLGIAKGINEGGAGALMEEALGKILTDSTPPIVIFMLFVFATMLLSNFISNSTALVILLPVALSICAAKGLNPLTFTMGMVFGANLTFSTPLANAQTAMTLVAGYRFTDYIKYTGILDVINLIAIGLFVPLVFPLTL